MALDYEWNCPSCTYINKAGSYKCFICSTPKGTSTRQVKFSFSSIEQQYVAESLQTMSRHSTKPSVVGGTGRRRKCGQPSNCKKRYLDLCSCAWHDQGKVLAKENDLIDSESTAMKAYKKDCTAEQREDTQNLELQDDAPQPHRLWVYYNHQQCIPVSVSNLVMGDVCCIYRCEDHCWYRGKILWVFNDIPGGDNHNGDDACLVLFVDYGIVEMVFWQNLYVLHKAFCELPCQALNIYILDIPANSPYELVGSVVRINIRGSNGNNFFVGFVSSEHMECHKQFQSVIKLKMRQVTFPFQAVVAHIGSVTDFYVHELDVQTAKQMKELEMYLHSYYCNENKHCVTEATVGSIVCIRSSVTDIYCRAIVLEEGCNECFVQLVDYGHSEKIPLDGVFELPVEFLLFPAFSVHCQLKDFENEVSTDEYTDTFKEMMSSVKIVTVIQGAAKHNYSSWNELFSVHLRDSGHSNLSHKSGLVCDWDPMQIDYISSWNKYHELDKKTTRFEHRNENISSYSLLPPLLPQTGDIVLIIITSVRTPRRVFAQLPLGPFAVSDDNDQCPALMLDNLLKDMNDYYSTKVFEEECHFVSNGEIVAAYKENNWYRAKIIMCSKENVTVFTVDFGDVFVIHSSYIRIIKEQFLFLPVQAIECFFQENSNCDNAREFVCKARDRVVITEVVDKYNHCLHLKLHDHNGFMLQLDEDSLYEPGCHL